MEPMVSVVWGGGSFPVMIIVVPIAVSAPCGCPSIEGLARGFDTLYCMSAPAVPSSAPVAIAVIVRYRRSFPIVVVV